MGLKIRGQRTKKRIMIFQFIAMPNYVIKQFYYTIYNLDDSGNKQLLYLPQIKLLGRLQKAW